MCIKKLYKTGSKPGLFYGIPNIHKLQQQQQQQQQQNKDLNNLQ